jgi:hypothetical protein
MDVALIAPDSVLASLVDGDEFQQNSVVGLHSHANIQPLD